MEQCDPPQCSLFAEAGNELNLQTAESRCRRSGQHVQDRGVAGLCKQSACNARLKMQRLLDPLATSPNDGAESLAA